MINSIISLLIIFSSLVCFGQSSLDSTELSYLVEIAETYSSGLKAEKDALTDKLVNIKTESLKNLVLKLNIKHTKETIFSQSVLSRPENEELYYWYVLREIHYNQSNPDSGKHTNLEIAKKTLNSKIDERWLLDNYYYRIKPKLSELFNTADLSDIDINLNDFGLKSETEKGILFLMITHACTQRFMIFGMTQKFKKTLDFASKLPSFNGAPYFKYTVFDYPDFEWIGHKKIESYNERHLGNLYISLVSNYMALNAEKRRPEAKELYSNSILSRPEFFKYSTMEEDLNKQFNESR